MRVFFSSILVAAFATAVCGQVQSVSKTLSFGGRERNYLLFVPSSYESESGERLPLIFNLHAFTIDADTQEFLSQMNVAAEERGYAVAYPNAPGMNWFNDSRRVEFVAEAVLEDIATQVNIDRSRVYATGFSQGGILSYELASAKPETFAAIASVAGTPLSIITPGRPMPTLHIHGTSDVAEPYEGGPGVFGGVFPPVEDLIDAVLALNNCEQSPTVSAVPDIEPNDGSTFELRAYSDCSTYVGDDGETRIAEVKFFRGIDMGHTWPGDKNPPPPAVIPTIYPHNLDLDATAEILDFFDQHRLPAAGNGSPSLVAGDADQDFDFDQFDLVQVQIAAKYLTGQAATWGEGDWNAAPGGGQGNPPAGDGMFNQLDIVAAQQAGIYLTGPYAGIQPNGHENDDQTSIVYNAGTGELAVDAPAGTELTSINIDSTSGIFTGSTAANLGGSFDNDADGNIFKATFGSSFGSLSFGNVAQAGLAEDLLLDDLSIIGSLAGGGDLGDVDLVYVPEPSTVFLIVIGSLALVACGRSVPNVRERKYC